MPGWWVYFEAADECNSQPWIMAGLPDPEDIPWLEWALIRRAALADAKEEIARKQEMASKIQSGRR